MCYGYDPDGEETSLTDAKDETTEFTHAGLGRVTTEVLPYPNGSASGGGSPATYSDTYDYDLDGDLLTATDPNNHICEFQVLSVA